MYLEYDAPNWRQRARNVMKIGRKKIREGWLHLCLQFNIDNTTIFAEQYFLKLYLLEQYMLELYKYSRAI